MPSVLPFTTIEKFTRRPAPAKINVLVVTVCDVRTPM
jgi:hypothetical protein